MSLVLSLPERLAWCLRDCDSRIVDAYFLTEENLDEYRRPCFVVSVGEERYDYQQAEQTFVDSSFTVEFIGQPFFGSDRDFKHTHEIEAREIALNALLYLLRRPSLQFSDERNLVGQEYGPLAGVMWARPESRSAVTLMEKGGAAEAFWGFTLSITCRSVILQDEDEVIIS